MSKNTNTVVTTSLKSLFAGSNEHKIELFGKMVESMGDDVICSLSIGEMKEWKNCGQLSSVLSIQFPGLGSFLGLESELSFGWVCEYNESKDGRAWYFNVPQRLYQKDGSWKSFDLGRVPKQVQQWARRELKAHVEGLSSNSAKGSGTKVSSDS